MEWKNNIDESFEFIRKTLNLTKSTSNEIIYNLIANNKKLQLIIDNLKYIKDTYKICDICFFYKINSLCLFCDDKERDRDIICVMDSAINAINFNKLKVYNGLYHILNGLIDIKKKQTPSSININSLINRIKRNKDIKEIVFALPSTSNGELTSHFIKKLVNFNCKTIKISQIAKGVPMGAKIDYLDNTTLKIAFKNRIEL